MDTINRNVLEAAAIAVEAVELDTVHTVTVTLNGRHGGADIIIQGFDSWSDEERNIKGRL